VTQTSQRLTQAAARTGQRATLAVAPSAKRGRARCVADDSAGMVGAPTGLCAQTAIGARVAPSRRLSAGTTKSVSGEKKLQHVQLPPHPDHHEHHRDHHLDNDHDDQDEDCLQMRIA